MKITMLRFTTAIALAISAPSFAQDAAVNVDEIRADSEFLASDALRGREAGTPEYDIAAKYVATQFMAMGVGPGDPDGDYMMPIQFQSYALSDDAPSYWEVDGQRFENGDKVFVTSNPAHSHVDGSAPLAFVGSAIYSPEAGIDQIGNFDLTGKIAVAIRNRSSEGLPSDIGAHLGSTQNEMLAARGAVGVVTILPEAMIERVGWDRLKSYLLHAVSNWPDRDGRPHTDTPSLTLGGVAGPEVRDILFADAPMSWAEIEAATKEGKTIAPFDLGKSLRVVSNNEIKPDYAAANVVGIIEGIDPALKDEVILMTAHLDHIGVDENAKPGEDNIYNGLFDNALGVAATLEVARMFKDSATPPKRSIAFVALASEEKGLKGSEWLAANLDQFAGKKVVGTINLDMPVLPADFDRLVVYGAMHSTIGRQVDRALEGSGVKQIEDPQPQEAFFVRSDHYSFVRKGIPSVYLDPYPVEEAMSVYDDFMENRYHKVGDQVGQPLDWQSAAKFAKINYLITRQMTDDAAPPMWYTDSYFGKAMAPAAAKAKR